MMMTTVDDNDNDDDDGTLPDRGNKTANKSNRSGLTYNVLRPVSYKYTYSFCSTTATGPFGLTIPPTSLRGDVPMNIALVEAKRTRIVHQCTCKLTKNQSRNYSVRVRCLCAAGLVCLSVVYTSYGRTHHVVVPWLQGTQGAEYYHELLAQPCAMLAKAIKRRNTAIQTNGH